MKSKQVLALIISRVFDPLIEIPLILSMVAGYAIMEGYRWRFFGLLIFLDVILPGLYFLYLLISKKISDWDISLREQRISLLIFTLITHFFGVLVAYLIDRNILAQILLSFWVLGLIITLTTLKWKISIHSAVNASLVILLILIYGTKVWWLFLLPLVVSWSRVVRRKHTLLQVAAGTLLPVIVLPPLLYNLWR